MRHQNDSMRLVRFSDVTEELARKEGEGDLSIKSFFTRAGFYADDMELVAEEFEVVEVCNRTDHA
jgi:uncharacterized protein YhfF